MNHPETMRAQLVSSCQIADAALLILDAPSIARTAMPGQFVMVRIPNRPDMLTPRPLSITDADPKTGTICLLVKMRGRGTTLLRNLQSPSKLLLWGPCGRPFRIPQSGPVLLVAGGVGVAPLIFLAKKLKKLGMRTTAIFGAKTQDQLYLKETLRQHTDRLILCTEDGTCGKKGTATQQMAERLNKSRPGALFLCGPPAMVEAALPLIKKEKIPAQILLEGRMLCGLGVCGCCTISWEGRRIRLCTDGAVVDIIP